MRKTILLAVIACILGIVLLAALAFYIPNSLRVTRDDEQSEMFTGFQISTQSSTPPAPSSDGKKQAASGQDTDLPYDTLPDDGTEQAARQQELTEERETQTEPVQRFKDLPQQVKPHQIIWVGDSRTLGLRDALHKANRADDDLFVGKVGEGVHWFQEEGMSEMSDVIEQHPDLPVVLNLGVNDPQLVNEYVVAYWDVIRDHPDTRFYILSVNPLDEEFLIEDGQVAEQVFHDINSLNVAKMNVKLKEEFASRYIDSASYLKSDGFDTVDGLHFTMQTYLKIHDFVVSRLF